uniref:RED-like N-terminal domain-containing protein n=1 Tax=Petromyzon marinus TaxID=7757 RepID=S4RST7_PETMA
MSPCSLSASRLTNDDFRRLLMTPRTAPTQKSTPADMTDYTYELTHKHECTQGMPREYNEDEDPAARRRKKKSYYAKLKLQEQERERELAEKYRDRARERRDGLNKDYEETDTISTTANYRAVGPSAEADKSAAEKRRQLIQESKFLGGDMEHTHLVKGLDFALLQKAVCTVSFIFHPMLCFKKNCSSVTSLSKLTAGIFVLLCMSLDARVSALIVTPQRCSGRNVFRVLFRHKPPERNELFLPGRMAYVVDLEDDYADTDIPTTLIRSKADCPTLESHTTLTTNDIVINKLTQILSYLRQGTRPRKLKKKERGRPL